MSQVSGPIAIPKPGPKTQLSAVVVMDYQNMHLTGRDRFRGSNTPAHECLVHPYLFAQRVLAERNARQKEGHLPARLKRIEVYRGQPDATHEPRGFGVNESQAIEWRASDPRVQVTLRTLKYTYHRDATGQKIKDIHGRYEVNWNKPPMEKGVDVLCALALYRAAIEAHVDVVILASSDTDLIPAINSVYDSRQAKVETVFWGDKRFGGFGQLRPDKPRGGIWGTPLTSEDFEATLDRTSYRSN